MNQLFDSSIFLFLLTFIYYIGTYILPKIYFRIRLKKHFKLSEIEKEQKKAKEQTKKQIPLLNILIRKLENVIQTTSLPITVNEFLLVAFWINLAVAIISAVWIGLLFMIAILFIIDASLSIMLIRYQYHRKRKMHQQLLVVLEIISSALKTGYSIVQAFDLVAKEGLSPISEEFARLVYSLKLGRDLDIALKDFSVRIDLAEIETLVSAIIITRETGGNLTYVIEGVMDVIREEHNLIGEVKVYTAQGRLTGWVVGVMPLVLFCFLLVVNREYILILFKYPLGSWILGAAGIFQVIGFLIIRQMTNLKVR